MRGGIRETLAALPPEVLGRGPARRIHLYRTASRFATDLSFVDPTPRKPWFLWAYLAAGLVIGGLYLGAFALLPAELQPRRRLAFAAFSLFVFFLYAKGWSPQFILYLIPLLLIVFPVGEGALWCLLLTLTAFLETPVWTHHVLGRPGLVAASRLLLQFAVITRTILLLVVTIRILPRCFRD